MDRQQIGLKLATEALELPLSVDTFSDRLILQKLVVIVQAAGVDLGYHFHWYLRGPYSPTLTRDAFAASTEARGTSEEFAGWHLDETSQKRLENLRGLFRGEDRQVLASRLELLGSVLYLLCNRRVSGNDTAELQKILRAFGKSFSEDEITSALKELKKYGLWGTASE